MNLSSSSCFACDVSPFEFHCKKERSFSCTVGAVVRLVVRVFVLRVWAVGSGVVEVER